MAVRNPIVETIRARLPIATLIGETVDLVHDGHALRGECSLHRDHDKGLFVHNGMGIYRCYACGRQGDIVQWTRETAYCTEDAAIALLCQRVGLEYPQG